MNIKKLNDPILIAAWPGMGHVALTACYYLMSKLKMEVLAEYAASELFDVDHVSVESGLVQPFRYPRSQFFAWRNPAGERDLLLFVGESQPQVGRYDFCRKLIDYAQREGVTRVFTFAAMATPMGLEDESRAVGAATDNDTLQEMVEQKVALLSGGSISGLNGILLGVASERNIPGGCLLGEMPMNLINVPFPRASLAVLEAFGRMTGTPIDVGELKVEVERMDQFLADALNQLRLVEQQNGEHEADEPDPTFVPDPAENGKLTAEQKEYLESLFSGARSDRSKAYELKRELDRLNVFREYEDRFLDLFKSDNDG